MDNLKPSIEKLATDLHTVRTLSSTWSGAHGTLLDLPPPVCTPQIKQVQDEERKQLTQLRDVLKSALQVEQKEVTHREESGLNQRHTHTHTRVGPLTNESFEGMNLLENEQ